MGNRGDYFFQLDHIPPDGLREICSGLDYLANQTPDIEKSMPLWSGKAERRITVRGIWPDIKYDVQDTLGTRVSSETYLLSDVTRMRTIRKK